MEVKRLASTQGGISSITILHPCSFKSNSTFVATCKAEHLGRKCRSHLVPIRHCQIGTGTSTITAGASLDSLTLGEFISGKANGAINFREESVCEFWAES